MKASTIFAICAILLSPAAMADLEAEIASHCEAEWPTDFQMQSYCVDTQFEGLKAMVAFMDRYGIEEVITGDSDELERLYSEGNAPVVIAFDCWSEWTGDYQMIAYCMQTQEQAAKKLGKL